MNKAHMLVEKLFSFYEEVTLPCPVEMRDDMLGQIMGLIPTMEPGGKEELDDFVAFLGAQRLGLSGSTEDILGKMHPWMLQMVLQRFKTPAISPKIPGM